MDYRDVIAAFADQEPVDVDALSTALANEDAREYFIDILLLRGMVGGAETAEPKKTRKSRTSWLAAAAFVTIGLGAGFMAARATINRTTDQVASSEGAAAASPAPATGDSAAPAPAPTHVIRLENGVEWNERSGGK